MNVIIFFAVVATGTASYSIAESVPVVPATSSTESTDAALSREKRAALTAIIEVGCGAYGFVRHCTDDLDSCGDFCELVDAVCSIAAGSTGVIEGLCNTGEDDVETIVMEDYHKCSHGNHHDAERFITVLGGDVHAQKKTVWLRIISFFRNVYNTVKSWFH